MTVSCGCGKRRYLSRSNAQNVARRKRAQLGRMQPYRCPDLDGIWHIGHISPRVANGQLDKDDWLANKRGATR